MYESSRYQPEQYAALKKKIDALFEEVKNPVSLEIAKAGVLVEFAPYRKFLAQVCKTSEQKIADYITELGNDVEFFENISGNLLELEVNQKKGLETGDLRVHSYSCYVVMRCLKPKIAVETGVANGKSSAFLLNALKKNGMGKLISVDLPEFENDAHHVAGDALIPESKTPGWLVPATLRKNWDLRIGDARILLPAIRKEFPIIQYFQHDSLHTLEHMTFELALAKDWVASNGLIGCDDITSTEAFEQRSKLQESFAFGTFGFLIQK